VAIPVAVVVAVAVGVVVAQKQLLAVVQEAFLQFPVAAPLGL
jgi:type III secretory pathway component EscS